MYLSLIIHIHRMDTSFQFGKPGLGPISQLVGGAITESNINYWLVYSEILWPRDEQLYS